MQAVAAAAAAEQRGALIPFSFQMFAGAKDYVGLVLFGTAGEACSFAQRNTGTTHICRGAMQLLTSLQATFHRPIATQLHYNAVAQRDALFVPQTQRMN